jgi:hypothetical protein
VNADALAVQKTAPQVDENTHKHSKNRCYKGGTKALVVQKAQYLGLLWQQQQQRSCMYSVPGATNASHNPLQTADAAVGIMHAVSPAHHPDVQSALPIMLLSTPTLLALPP